MTSLTKAIESNQNLNPEQDFLIDDQNFLLEIGRKVIQQLLDAEMTEFLAAKPYERNLTRQGYRSGSRSRTLKTRIGKLHFEVPCERSGRFKTKLFAHYQRSEQAFLLALQEMYLQGVSTRRIEKITEQLCSLPISASSISRITAKLDAELERWRKRRLTEEYFCLIVDARYEKVRANERVSSQGVLNVIGISAKTGQREIIGVYMANTETETSWSEVFRDLIQRGLHGVRIVVSDDHKGLKSALAR